MAQEISPLQLMISIVEQGQGARIIDYYTSHHISQHMQTSGQGTAASHMLDILGFDTAERDVVISCGCQKTVERLMCHLKDDDRSKLNVRGIAFSLRLSGASAIFALFISRMEGNPIEGSLEPMEQNRDHSLILVSVNPGYTDAVMDTARAAGARGGTVLRTRWIGSEEMEKHTGITLQEEKEVLAILAKNQDRNAIMAEIERVHCLRSPAQGTLLSLPVEATSRLD